MWLEPVLPVLAAACAAIVAWRHETRRLDRRTLYEPWDRDTTEEEFRRRLIGRRKRRRWGVTLLSAIAGSLAGTVVLLQLVSLSEAVRGG
jgi:hypothetical protein